MLFGAEHAIRRRKCYPGNDFNALFSLVPEFAQKLKAEHDAGGILVSVAGAPGSFNGRLFPGSSLHFITSFASLHWLSVRWPALVHPRPYKARENWSQKRRFPLYTPTTQELEDQVYREGSFTIDSMKQYYHGWMFENAPNMLSIFCRAVTESLICHHFGEEIIEPFFETHTRLLYERFVAGEDIGWCQITVALCKS